MFQFLKSSFSRGKTVPMTQRQTIENIVGDLNEILENMAEKPVFSIDPNSGTLSLTLPEQMPDEALALPAPDVNETEAKS